MSTPILMSGAMVRAVLREIERPGTGKTQTRRLLKRQPPTEAQFPGSVFGMCRAVADGIKVFSQNDYERLPKHPRVWDLVGSVGVARDAGFPTKYDARFFSGQLLWVRETWSARMTHGWTIADARSGRYQEEILYRADGHESIDGWWPSIHMPREFSRLTLEVTGVKVERLQDISEEDAKAEGAKPILVPPDGGSAPFVEGFRDLWTSINGPGSWEANPFVVAVSFTPRLKKIDQFTATPSDKENAG